MDEIYTSETMERPEMDMDILSWAIAFAAIAILLLYFPKTIVIALVGGLAIGLFAGGFKIHNIF